MIIFPRHSEYLLFRKSMGVYFYIVYRKQTVWKPVVYRLLESWSHDQSERKNISLCKTQFLAESSHNMWSLYP